MASAKRFISWNVNGLRSALGKGFLDFLAEDKPDVLCLQEIKATPDQIDLTWPDGYTVYWNPAEKKGYSGTAIFSRTKPLAVTNGIGVEEHDHEGRVITAEFPDYFLVNVYVPNSQRELVRLDYRTQRWEVAFLAYLKKLETKKPVVFCGDLNVAHTEIDLANPKSNRRNAGFTDEERGCFSKLLESGFIDTFREFEKDGGHYSWWTYRMNARARNIGWRIDYWVISEALRPRLKEAFILKDIMGSDHCPVGMTFD